MSSYQSIEKQLRQLLKRATVYGLASIAVGFSLLFLWDAYNAFTQEISSVARVVAATSRAAIAFDDAEAGKRVLVALRSVESIRYAALINNKQEVLAELGDTRPELKLKGLSFKENYEWSFGQAELVVPVRLEEEVVGNLVVVSSLTVFYQKLAILFFIALLLFALTAFVASRVSTTVRRAVIDPIITLHDLTQEISVTKDFTRRIDLVMQNENEIQQLIRSFNHMLEQIGERDRAVLQARDRAEEADKMKSVFLATVSHELRTPMHAILGMTDEVLETNLSTEQKELLEVVKSSGIHLVSIINDILDFSKIEAGKISLVEGAVRIRDLVDKVRQMFDVGARKKTLELKIGVDDNVPEVVIADGSRLAQVLVNLVGNALKFTTAGTVEINVTARPGAAREGAVQLEFSVKDTGLGIPEEYLQTIFDSFTQVHRSGSTNEGTGLGLSISSRLVRLMGGWIWAESRIGNGSTFRFVIDVVVVEARSAVEPSKDSSFPLSLESSVEPKLDAVILVVEDNKVNSALASRILTRAGYTVLYAYNGQECVDLLEKQSVDLILMDLSMPVMDGLTATKVIREREASSSKRTPIIAVTAHALEEQASKCIAAGMDGFLTKPLSKQQFLETVAAVLMNKGAKPASASTPSA